MALGELDQIEAVKYEILLDDAIRKEKARNTMADFVQYTMPEYQMKWFHKRICDALDKLLAGVIKKLMIFIPPQHGKSQLSSRHFPAYALGRLPREKIALVGYGATIAEGFNRNVQQIIDHPDYANLFPGTKLNGKNTSTDMKRGVLRNSKIFEIVDHMGYLKAVGVEGSLTSFSVDLGIIDDPFKDRKSAESKLQRDAFWDFYTDVFVKRLHNKSRQLLLFTRWHEDDPAGRILDPNNPHYDADEAAEWTVIKIPALKEDDLDPEDPREIGEALWEEKHARAKFEREARTRPRTHASLNQQRPAPEEGDLIKKAWFNYIQKSALPFKLSEVKIDIFIDGAYTDQTKNDPSALMACINFRNDLYILLSTQKWLKLHEFLLYFPKFAKSVDYNRKGTVYIEHKASGKSLDSMLTVKGYNAVPVSNSIVKKGKYSRAEDSSPTIEAGHVYLVIGGWNKQFVNEVSTFPNGNYDDQLDNLTAAVHTYYLTGQFNYNISGH